VWPEGFFVGTHGLKAGFARFQTQMQLDVASLTIVLQRITAPALTEHEIRNALSAPDLVQLGNAATDFLLPKSARPENADAPQE
jgi:hypothetical protein